MVVLATVAGASGIGLGLVLLAQPATAAVLVSMPPETDISLDTSKLAVAPAWTELSTITISEGPVNDFPAGQTGVTLVLVPPAGFEFNDSSDDAIAGCLCQDVPPASVSLAIAADGSQLTVTFSVVAVAKKEAISILIVDVRAISAVPTTGQT